MVKTISFQENYDFLALPSLKPHKVQSRVVDAWNEKYPNNEDASLIFTFRSKKKVKVIDFVLRYIQFLNILFRDTTFITVM